MKIRNITSLLLCLAVLFISRVTLQAQGFDGRAGVILGNPSGAMVTKPLTAVAPAMVPTNLYTIYSNLGPKHDLYDLTNGPAVQGPQGPNGQYPLQWIAVPFTPTGDAEVTEIELAVGWLAGFNGVTISLNANDNQTGLPGKAIHTWNLTNLYLAGGCCRLTVAKTAKGLKVSKGAQYWVVASTNARTIATYDLWNFNYSDATGRIAYLNSASGNQWATTSASPVPAVGVFGVKK